MKISGDFIPCPDGSRDGLPWRAMAELIASPRRRHEFQIAIRQS
nr:hypothetical protein [Rhizobium redzepovicii]